MALGFDQLAWFTATAAVIVGTYSSAIERHRIDTRMVRVFLRGLPHSFSGLRIALFSDVHLGFYYGPPQLLKAVATINGLAPDIACLTGDFTESDSSPGVLEPVVPILSRLKATLGKFAVLGNHDYRAGAGEVTRCLEKGGFRVLKNSHAVLKKENECLFIIGLDDVLMGRPDPENATRGIPHDACKILLVHEPDYAGFANRPVDLQLSGHSHGGQVCFPFLGPIITTRLGKKYVSGLYSAGKSMLYTNRGLGTTILPIRFLCRPEITLITLHTK